MLSNSSSDLLSALQSHPLLIELIAAVESIRRSANMQIQLHEYDGAAPNAKLHAAMARTPRFRQLAPDCFHQEILCANHTQHLVTLAVIAQMNTTLTNDILLGGMFLSNNGHRACMVPSRTEW